ncbi:MAG: matrixin family metalloprotease [Planctomycetes bacterium]|nr:matrixin family metalloprotease [Planctomycetota bacterium]
MGASPDIEDGLPDHTIYLDINAAAWRWFVDSTPWDDSEFTTPGNQGERNRMDLLTVLEHELGHILGLDHTDWGLMSQFLATGVRLAPTAVIDAVFTEL